jgi:hypothetical protein
MVPEIHKLAEKMVPSGALLNLDACSERAKE